MLKNFDIYFILFSSFRINQLIKIITALIRTMAKEDIYQMFSQFLCSHVQGLVVNPTPQLKLAEVHYPPLRT